MKSRTPIFEKLIAFAQQHHQLRDGEECYWYCKLSAMSQASVQHSKPMSCFVCDGNTNRVTAYALSVRSEGTKCDGKRMLYVCQSHLKEG